jgi:hypothetical protein
MSKKPNEFYVQCELRRVNGQIDMAWIPEQYARKGKFLRIRNHGKWENGWEVTAVYSRKHADEVLENERLYLVQREASDI